MWGGRSRVSGAGRGAGSFPPGGRSGLAPGGAGEEGGGRAGGRIPARRRSGLWPEPGGGTRKEGAFDCPPLGGGREGGASGAGVRVGGGDPGGGRVAGSPPPPRPGLARLGPGCAFAGCRTQMHLVVLVALVLGAPPPLLGAPLLRFSAPPRVEGVRGKLGVEMAPSPSSSSSAPDSRRAPHPSLAGRQAGGVAWRGVSRDFPPFELADCREEPRPNPNLPTPNPGLRISSSAPAGAPSSAPP